MTITIVRASLPEDDKQPNEGSAELKVDRESVQHYKWGADCDGWVLSPSRDQLVLEERMPPRTAERRHFHSKARQFFYVLSGSLTMELDGLIHRLSARSGIEIHPGSNHQARNDGVSDVYFLVISTPTTRGDRTDID
jgi:mannose-6-phosphate isomerase-like protein (cupin superfamily)